MAKITVGDITVEGTIEELKELGIEFEDVKEPRQIEVGDYVKVIDDSNSDFYRGTILQVTAVDSDDECCPYLAENVFGDEKWMTTKEVMLATDSEIVEHKRQIAIDQLEDDLIHLYDAKEDIERDITRTEHALFEVMK